MIARAAGVLAVLAAFAPSCEPACEEPPGPPPASTTTTPATTMPSTTMPATTTTTTLPAGGDITSIRLEGQGRGHGRGLSQWGSYGSAVNLGWTWTQILDHYYGGTQAGTVDNTTIGVRLIGMDGAVATGVVSTTGQATWNGSQHTSLQARETSRNVYDVFAASDLRCPGSTDGWTLVQAGVAGPITFTTAQDETTAPAGDVLGLCQPGGSVIHYRGAITAVNDSNGANRTVNSLLLENYLRGVVPRESPTSWGDAGSARQGMNALRAQSVAARSFVLVQNRYSYARTCDTNSCQVYGGAAHRATPRSATSHPGSRVCERGNETFECANTNRAVADTAGAVRRWPSGAVVSTEFDSSHGPYTAGGVFPSVDDTASNVPANPTYRWTRSIDAAAIADRYDLGELTAATSEPNPATDYVGVWDNRVRLVGTLRTVTVSNWDFRSAFSLVSAGYSIAGVERG